MRKAVWGEMGCLSQDKWRLFLSSSFTFVGKGDRMKEGSWKQQVVVRLICAGLLSSMFLVTDLLTFS